MALLRHANGIFDLVRHLVTHPRHHSNGDSVSHALDPGVVGFDPTRGGAKANEHERGSRDVQGRRQGPCSASPYTATGATTCREVGARNAAERRLNAFVDTMLDLGVLLFPSGAGAISTPMRDPEIEHLLTAATTALPASA